MPAPVVAEIVRSGFVEGHHYGSVVALAADGSVDWSVGDVRSPILPRSCNKPLQAVAMLEAGLRLDGELLALASASHSGEDFHLDGVRRILAGAELDEGALQTPADYPLDDQAREELLRSGGTRSSIAMNCSGKHAAMLATCVANGWDTSTYLAADHPLQVAIGHTFAELTGEPVEVVATDGCGAPLLSASLTGLARAFQRLVEAEPGTPERRVADEMRAHPELVAGTGVDDTVLMGAVPGLLAKGGAEGVVAVAVPGVGAVALKIADGAMRPRTPVLLSALEKLGVPAPHLKELILGGGEPVGEVRSVW